MKVSNRWNDTQRDHTRLIDRNVFRIGADHPRFRQLQIR